MSDEIVREFLVESAENLDLLDRELVRLEKDPHNRDTPASVFRTIHTIKGTCGFLGFTKLESVAHVGENLLSKLRDGELALNPDITTALLQMVDAIRQMLASVEAVGNEGERNDQALIETLTRLLQGAAQGKPQTGNTNVKPGASAEAGQKPPIAELSPAVSRRFNPERTSGCPRPDGISSRSPRFRCRADRPEPASNRGSTTPESRRGERELPSASTSSCSTS